MTTNPLPKRISPNPLLTSTVEMRFKSDLTFDQVLTKFYPAFAKSYPNVKDASNIPRELKLANPQLEFSADYIFNNADYSVSVGRNVIAFENIGTYHLWTNYFKEICENLKLLDKLKVVKSIVRIGVRYASFFEGQRTVSKILKEDIGINYSGYEERLQLYQTNFKKDNVNLFLQIGPNATTQKSNEVKTGFLIDIDASLTGNGNLAIGSKLYDIIDKLHSEEKRLFFWLLKDDFLKTLNPEY